MPALIEFEKADTKYIVREYNNGWSITVLAEEFSVSVTTIRRVLVAEGTIIRPRGRQSQ